MRRALALVSGLRNASGSVAQGSTIQLQKPPLSPCGSSKCVQLILIQSFRSDFWAKCMILKLRNFREFVMCGDFELGAEAGSLLWWKPSLAGAEAHPGERVVPSDESEGFHPKIRRLPFENMVAAIRRRQRWWRSPRIHRGRGLGVALQPAGNCKSQTPMAKRATCM